MDGLSHKQKRFVAEYVLDKDGNATQAAIRAGYRKGAEVTAARMLKMTKIIDAIAKAQEARTIRTEINADRILKELARVGLSDPRKLLNADGSVKPPSEWDDDTAATVASIKVIEKNVGTDEDGKPIIDRTYEVRTWDKNAALDKIAKHFGMFIERQEITVTHRIAQMSDDELDGEIARELGQVSPAALPN